MWRRWLGIGLLWVCAPLYALVVRVGLTAISPHDYWWPIVQGRAAEQLGEIPASNLFLYTLPEGYAFFNQPWLSQRLMWWVHEAGGPALGVYLNAALLCVSFLVLMWGARWRGASLRINAGMAMCAAVLASSGMSVRTQMFAVPCFAVVVTVLSCQSVVGRPSLRRLWPLLWAVPLWSNVHGSFVLAPVMVGCFGLGAILSARESMRNMGYEAMCWGGIGTVVLGLTLLNPHGWEVYAYVFDLTSKMGGGGEVSEWAPLSIREVEGVVFHVAAVLSLVGVLWWRRAVGWGGGLCFGVMWLLALTGRRNLIWWAMSAQVFLAIGASAWWRARGSSREEVDEPRGGGLPWRAEATLNVVLCAVLWGGASSCLPGGLSFRLLTEGGEERTDHLPYQGHEALNREHPLKLLSMLGERERGEEEVRVFHSQSIGGLVEYALARDAPRRVAFVDQRFEMVTASVWEDYFLVMSAAPEYEERLRRWGVTHLLVDEEDGAKLIEASMQGRVWCEQEKELGFVLFERCR